MALSKNLGQYGDVETVLAAALRNNGARYTLPSRAEAVRWRQRAYYYRKLLYDVQVDAYRLFPGMTPSTPYDKMTLRLEDRAVIINFDKPTGIITTLEGGVPMMEEGMVEEEDELLSAAKKLAEEHGI